jgi:hypothetical protein
MGDTLGDVRVSLCTGALGDREPAAILWFVGVWGRNGAGERRRSSTRFEYRRDRHATIRTQQIDLRPPGTI